MVASYSSKEKVRPASMSPFGVPMCCPLVIHISNQIHLSQEKVKNCILSGAKKVVKVTGRN